MNETPMDPSYMDHKFPGANAPPSRADQTGATAPSRARLRPRQRAAEDPEAAALYDELGRREDMHAIVMRGDADGVAVAAAAGMSLDEFDDEGYSPAHYAAARNSPGCLRALANGGVDLARPGARSGALVASAAAARDGLAALREL